MPSSMWLPVRQMVWWRLWLVAAVAIMVAGPGPVRLLMIAESRHRATYSTKQQQHHSPNRRHSDHQQHQQRSNDPTTTTTTAAAETILNARRSVSVDGGTSSDYYYYFGPRYQTINTEHRRVNIRAVPVTTIETIAVDTPTVQTTTTTAPFSTNTTTSTISLSSSLTNEDDYVMSINFNYDNQRQQQVQHRPTTTFDYVADAPWYAISIGGNSVNGNGDNQIPTFQFFPNVQPWSMVTSSTTTTTVTGLLQEKNSKQSTPNHTNISPPAPSPSPVPVGEFATLPLEEKIFRIFGATICVALILCTIIGNVLVIIVVVRFHRMRTVTNILLASLAIADITVASLVMPFTVVYDLYRYWPWGPVLCHFWISCDVMCCTASILHLCCVAIDRFWAITRPLRYRSLISKRRLFCCISMIWFCSAAISFIPIFSGWYHSQGQINVFTMETVNECGLDVNRVYATISSLTSFYLPLPIMFYVYFRILLVAERQSREIKQLEQSLKQSGLLSANYHHTQNTPSTTGLNESVPPTPFPRSRSTEQNSINIGIGTGSGGGGTVSVHFGGAISFDEISGEKSHGSTSPGALNGSNSMNHMSAMAMAMAASQETLENKQHAERSLRRRARQLITDTKAIRTLGIVMGVFCLCWLPFFIMYVISAYCPYCNISYTVRSSITWLGYINSALNPAIYAYLNKEFKMAFKRVIFCIPRGQLSSSEAAERDAFVDEVSNTSRSYQHRNMDHRNSGNNFSGNHQKTNNNNNNNKKPPSTLLDVPPAATAGHTTTTTRFVSRTPSANIAETTNWVLIHGQ